MKGTAKSAALSLGRSYVLGYDPGGNGKHGVAALEILDGRAKALETSCCATAGEALVWLSKYPKPVAVGIDTLLAWSGARSGDRGADVALRRRYKKVQKSIVRPNSLYGAMCISGVFVASHLVALYPGSRPALLETHPKVLYLARWSLAYNWPRHRRAMTENLSSALSLRLKPAKEEHEFDASLSAYVAFEAVHGDWAANDLLRKERDRLYFPAGPASYPWPEPL